MNNPAHQPYDCTLKGLFKEEADGILSYLVPGLRLIGRPLEAERNVEIVRTVVNLVKKTFAEGEIKGKAEGKAEGLAEGKSIGIAEGAAMALQEAIIDLIADRFPMQVVSAVQQAVVPVQNTDQLKNFLRRVTQVSSEEEVRALLAECFPQSEPKSWIEGIRDSILEIVGARFTPQLAATVQQTIAPVQNAAQLKKFLHYLVQASTEREVRIMLTFCFPGSLPVEQKEP
jgi:hypothetical protein